VTRLNIHGIPDDIARTFRVLAASRGLTLGQLFEQLVKKETGQ
jgi:hypothetical protein